MLFFLNNSLHNNNIRTIKIERACEKAGSIAILGYRHPFWLQLQCPNIIFNSKEAVLDLSSRPFSSAWNIPYKLYCTMNIKGVRQQSGTYVCQQKGWKQKLWFIEWSLKPGYHCAIKIIAKSITDVTQCR